jgi:hypothetical protein
VYLLDKEFAVNIRKLCGVVLIFLLISSAAACLLSVWGQLDEQIMARLLISFSVIGGVTLGTGYILEKFFDNQDKAVPDTQAPSKPGALILEVVDEIASKD